jgi:peptidoglycan/xylan/chitin deacetylase (PgdA/CDA1 family)
MTSIPNLVTVDLDETSASAASGECTAIVEGLIDALGRSNTSATFFVPRPFVDAQPALARRLSDAGHEVACLTVAEPAKARPYCASFTAELEASRTAIEDATGKRVRGHRNASFAVDYESEWVYDVLVDRGFEYDSSRVPPKYVEFGYQPIPHAAHTVRRWAGTLLEVPVSTTDILAMRVRVGTMSSVRGLPLPVWATLVDGRRSRGESLVMHLRASELRRASRLRSQSAPANRRAIERVGRIVGKFPFTSVANALPELLRSAPMIES